MNTLTISLVVLLAGFPAAAEPRIAGDLSASEARAVVGTLEDLDLWLDVYTDLPRSDVPLARVALIEPGADISYEGRMMQIEQSVRGVYDEETATIYLVRQWYGETAFDRSVLLHEMVHHRQANARHWYCPQAMEWDAYLIQERYLNALGETGDFNWGWVLLASSCAVRDHHPE